MKITIISFDNWGFNQRIADHLTQKGHTANHIDFSSFQYKYPNLLYKIYNFLLKLFVRKNIKHIYYGKEIIKRLESLGKQDIILTLKGDFIASESIRDFKNYTNRSIAFFNDNVRRYPNIANVIPYFDEVYSFEEEDCRKYNLKFATNFIYEEDHRQKDAFEYDVFNVSSKDKRAPKIIDIARKLKEAGLAYKIIILDKKNKLQTDSLEVIHKPIGLDRVNHFIENAKALLDFHREKQNGLSFRVFESLGKQKKLITTNAAVKNYDFYNPNNIYIIENNEFAVNKTFFKTPYEPVPSEVYHKYTMDGWIKSVLNI
jgi:hypothetical protein